MEAREADLLKARGGPGVATAVDRALAEQPEAAGPESLRQTAWKTAGLGMETYSLAEAAELLGQDRRRVSHLLATGRLWSFKVGRSQRIPRWQIVDGDLLPGLNALVEAVPPGLTPASLASFMAAPQAELGNRSPAVYLACGGDAAPVVAMLAALGEW
ncbi:MAG: helix-turn-helix domain-containing protein [Bifidobacteriaceae bacterium]|nr:helix-turn-helix domain-containing protein [Bifidobacteriaceae bacterium]